jgi:deoxyribose-phosphate aldolase
MTALEAARLIDHALLHPTLAVSEVRRGLVMAREAGCAAVCVRPSDTAFAAEILAGSATKVCTVIAFPHGSTSPQAKAAEAKMMVDSGAEELDMVVNNGHVHSGDWEAVAADIDAVVRAAEGRLLKVIFETDFQTIEQIIGCCRAARQAGADFVKTSTGFGFVKADGGYGYTGATVEHVRLMKEHAAPLRVKASGGIRSLASLLAMVEAGADRIGASATESILAEALQASARTSDGG